MRASSVRWVTTAMPPRVWPSLPAPYPTKILQAAKKGLPGQSCRITISNLDIGVQHFMANDPVTRHFFNGFIRLHILYHAAKEAIYGAEIAEELVRHGYRLSQGTLYPTLHALQDLRYLNCETKLVDGRQRKYYRATAKGRKVLDRARGKLRELISEVVEDRDEPFQALRRRRRQRHNHVSPKR